IEILRTVTQVIYCREISYFLLIDIRNMLTLRYDPTIEIKTSVPKVVPDQVKINRNKTYPSSKEIEKELRQIIKNNISKFEPKTISLALSTGVDSNLMLSLIRDEYPKLDIKCISVSFDDTSESTYAKKIAESKDTDFYNVTVDNLLKDLPSLISIIKEGDDWKRRVSHYLECHERDWVPDQETIFGENIKFDWSSIYRILKIYFDNDLNPLDQVFLADYSGKLIYDFVPTNDKFFNYFGVTGLSPILDDKIIDMSFRIPPSIKFSNESNMGKIPLREILSRLEAKNIADTKIGFGMDLKKLWITNAKEIVISTLSSASIFRDKIISRDFYDRSIKRIDETCDLRYISKMLQLLSLEIWYKMYITFEVSSKYSL